MSKKKQESSVPEKRNEEPTALPALYEGDAGVGFEKTTSDDYALPFLKLLQKMSPEVDPDSGAHVDGARPGMYYDTATGELLESVDFIPCYYHRAIVEWHDREEGGGFVAQHEPGYEQKFQRSDKGGRWITPEGTYLADTRYFFGLRLKNGGDVTHDVISFGSTQIKKSRAWLTRMQALKFTRSDNSRATLPIFAHVWRLTSIPEENDKGSWRGYKVDLVGPISDTNPIRAAKEAHDMFRDAAARFRPPAGTTPSESDVPF